LAEDRRPVRETRGRRSEKKGRLDVIQTLRASLASREALTLAVVLAVLGLAFLLGWRASVKCLGLLVAGLAAFVILLRPGLGLPALILAALVVPIQFGTGTEVTLNAVTLLIPVLLALWLLQAMARRPGPRLTTGALSRTLALFLLASLVSLLVGVATWDPTIPRNANFTFVQLGQWVIFAFSAGAFWLAANLATEEKWLRRMTFSFLAVGGVIAIGRQLPAVGDALEAVSTIAFSRAPFWVLLFALAGGQLLFNQSLSSVTKGALVAMMAGALMYSLGEQQETASNWVGLSIVASVLFWLRFPRLRWLALALVSALAVSGLLFPSLYQFAGGDAEWIESGGSRLVLAERVLEVTMRNPITGLGPAAYRPYANANPLSYQGAYWVAPRVSSHNNYVDIFAHAGINGLLLFFWFAWEVGRLGLRLRRRYESGFSAAYVNGVLAAGAASLVIMMLADWILPFVYNVGFPGFQASVLVWLFLGGLVALENMPLSDCPTRLESAALRR
jgi:O-antigen ligase